MALHDDLLAQARHLAGREGQNPRQASLRRAVSTAYYALFHALVAEACAVLAPPQPENLRAIVGRTFVHSDMRKVCETFSRGQIRANTAKLLNPPLRSELTSIARIFMDAQDARQKADYDTLEAFSRPDVIALIGDVEQSLSHLSLVRGEPNSNVFFAALLLQPRWER